MVRILIRHFTATAFVVHDDHIALHWHPKIQEWLPPGGHVDMNEDPVQAVVREIEEETGISAKVISTGPHIDLAYPMQVPPPLTIMIEDIQDPVDGYHQHIDMIYVCVPARPVGKLRDGWLWVDRDSIAQGIPLHRPDGHAVVPPEDVRVLAYYAFEAVTSDRDFLLRDVPRIQ